MLSVFRPSFEVVKEGRILNQIKHLQKQFANVSCLVPGSCQVFEGFYDNWF
jgi:hypothetical protein